VNWEVFNLEERESLEQKKKKEEKERKKRKKKILRRDLVSLRPGR